jgi:hypothetical protein
MSSVLLNLLGALGDVAKLLHFGIHDALRHVLLTKSLGELLLRDTPWVLVGVTVAVPLGACSASELVGGYPHALLVSAGGEIQLIFYLTEPVLGGDGVIVGGVESRRPQLEKTLQLPLEVIGRTPVAVKHPLSQCLQEAGLAVHHLRQLWWWWRRRRRFSFRMLGGTHPQCRLLWCRLLPDTEGNFPASSTASTTTMGHRRGGKRAVV